MLSGRVQSLKSTKENKGESVTYVMSRDQRLLGNHALIYAQKLALERKQPLSVVFVLSIKGVRAREHYEFMMAGLRELEISLKAKNIPLIMIFGEPVSVLQNFFAHTRPSAVIFDFSPLKAPRKLIDMLLPKLDADVAVVDTHNLVPIWQASTKQEVGARTLRPKINRQLLTYLHEEPEEIVEHPFSWPGTVISLAKLGQQLETSMATCNSNGQKLSFKSGELAASEALNDFISNRLQGYAELRNKPEAAHTSDLSPYLHFGQLSSLQVVGRVLDELARHPELSVDTDTLKEEMVVRKELSDNFCYYAPSYRTLDGAPQWAKKTLDKHHGDPREHIYSLQEFEQAKTHDPAWNAAQTQLLNSGKMHGYMRMYWAKKVLEWSKSPEQALETLIYLNDFYSIDGGDPNGYTGIMWSVCGVHDRPWGERPVYGMIRSMVYGGLKRKFDIKAYEQQWGS